MAVIERCPRRYANVNRISGIEMTKSAERKPKVKPLMKFRDSSILEDKRSPTQLEIIKLQLTSTKIKCPCTQKELANPRRSKE